MKITSSKKINGSNKRKFTVQAARVGKTKEVIVLQGNYGYGWDDLVEYETSQQREAKQDLRDYRENERNAQHRLIRRRVANPNYVAPTDNKDAGTIESSTRNKRKFTVKASKSAKKSKIMASHIDNPRDIEALTDYINDVADTMISVSYAYYNNSEDWEVHLYMDSDEVRSDFMHFIEMQNPTVYKSVIEDPDVIDTYSGDCELYNNGPVYFPITIEVDIEHGYDKELVESLKHLRDEYRKYLNYGLKIVQNVLGDFLAPLGNSDIKSSSSMIKSVNSTTLASNSTSATRKFTIKASKTDTVQDESFIDDLWNACYDVDNLQDIDFTSDDADGTSIIFTYGNTTNDYDSRESQLISALKSAGYNATYEVNNGSNVIVLRVVKPIIEESTSIGKRKFTVKASSKSTVCASTDDIDAADIRDALWNAGFSADNDVEKTRTHLGTEYRIWVGDENIESSIMDALQNAGYNVKFDTMSEGWMYLFITDNHTEPKYLYRVSYGYTSDIVEMDDETSDYGAVVDKLIDDLESSGNTGYLMAVDEAESEYSEDMYTIGGNHGLALIHNGNLNIEPIGWSNEVDVNASTDITASIGRRKPGTSSDAEYYEALASGVADQCNTHWNDTVNRLVDITYDISDTAITFIDGEEIVYIQPIENITPNWDDLSADIDELAGSVIGAMLPF